METFWGRYGNVGNDLAHRLEVLSGACGASFWSKSSREVRNGHKCTFFQSFRKFEKWEVPKKLLAMQSELFLSGWNRSGVNRWPGGRAMSGNVQVLREKLAWCGFRSLDIPFSTWRFLDCRDPGCAPRNEERWPWVAARL